jgi:hypothetical protein
MELYRFDAAVGRPISKYGSHFVQVPLTSPEGGVRAACFHLPPGGVVGRHEVATRQLLCVVAGEGWVSGPKGDRVPIAAAGPRSGAGVRRTRPVPTPVSLRSCWRATTSRSGRRRMRDRRQRRGGNLARPRPLDAESNAA